MIKKYWKTFYTETHTHIWIYRHTIMYFNAFNIRYLEIHIDTYCIHKPIQINTIQMSVPCCHVLQCSTMWQQLGVVSFFDSRGCIGIELQHVLCVYPQQSRNISHQRAIKVGQQQSQINPLQFEVQGSLIINSTIHMKCKLI